MQTQCPHCHTVFRVTAEQLKVGGGRARCGWCGETFDALATLADAPGTMPPFVMPQAAADSGEERGPSADTAPQDTGELPSQSTISQAWGETADGGSTAGPGDDWSIGAMMSESQARAYLNGDRDWDTIGTDPSTIAEIREPLADGLAQRVPQATPGEPLSAQPDEAFAFHSKELWRLDEVSHPKRWVTTLLWAMGSLALAALLATQYAYFDRDRLSQRPGLRPWLAGLCSVTGCRLPAFRDLTQVRLLRRDVRTHPDKADALLINTTMVNVAPLPQPFPVLRLSLSDLNGKVIAQRAFNPSEYLAKDVDISRGMLPEVPAHVSLEAVRPEGGPLNFEFSFQ